MGTFLVLVLVARRLPRAPPHKGSSSSLRGSSFSSSHSAAPLPLHMMHHSISRSCPLFLLCRSPHGHKRTYPSPVAVLLPPNFCRIRFPSSLAKTRKQQEFPGFDAALLNGLCSSSWSYSIFLKYNHGKFTCGKTK